MPRPANTLRVALVGQLPNGENFQTGFWLSYTGAIAAGSMQGIADAIAAAFVANSSFIRAMTTPTTIYQAIRVYRYTAAGPAPADAIAEAEINLPGLVTGNFLHPLQIALVATLRTGSVGRRYRGRMYFPLNAGDLPGHQASQVLIDGLADNVADWFNAINISDSAQMEVVVMSEVGSMTNEVTQIDVDSRCDVQRRRANQETELRQAVPANVT
jgi:hypothetical protein